MPSSSAGSPIAAAAGGSFLLESALARRRIFHAGRPERRTTANCCNRRPICAGRDFAAHPCDRSQGTGRFARDTLRKAAELGFGLRSSDSRGIRWPGDGQNQFDAGYRSCIGVGELLHGVRRAHRHCDTAAGLVWNRRAKKTLPAETCFLRMDRSVWALRGDLRLGRDEHPHPRYRCSPTARTIF